MSGNFGYGSKFKATISAVLTEIAGLTNIKGLDLSADEIDTTAHNTADGYRTFVQGLKDGGTIEIEGYYSNLASQIGLKTIFDAGASTACEIIFAGTSMGTWTFNAIPTGLSTEAPLDGLVGFTASLKVTGKPTLA
jgi:predicted secreted protein